MDHRKKHPRLLTQETLLHPPVPALVLASLRATFRRTVATLLLSPFLLAALLLGCGGTPPSEGDALVIGAVLPLTGDNARYGVWIREALELYKSKLNNDGGINGARLEIVYEDDQAKPELATLAMRKLVDVHKVPIVYGSWASSSVLAQAPIAEESRTIVMAQAISPKIRDAGDHIFRSIPDAEHSLDALVPHILEIGCRSSAILYVNNDYGIDQAAVFRRKFTAGGGEVVFEEGYNLDQQTFLPVLAKLNSVSFDCLYLPGYSEVGLILRQATEMGIKARVFASDPFENEAILEVAKDAAEEVVYPFYYIPGRGSQELEWFEDAYANRYGRRPEGSAALAYNGLDVLIAALRLADDNRDTDRIKKALYSIKDFDGVLGNLSIDDHGDMHLPIFLKTVRDGRFVELKTSTD